LQLEAHLTELELQRSSFADEQRSNGALPVRRHLVLIVWLRRIVLLLSL
jgi:hypothetical protein